MADQPADDLGKTLWKRADRRRTKRQGYFDARWQELSQYFWPDVSDINTEKTEGDDWFNRIFDSSPVRASQTCSVGVRNWVTPSTEQWLGLAPPYNLLKQAGSANPRLNRIGSNPASQQVDDSGRDEATRWCDELAGQLMDLLSASNFYSVVQTFNRSACTFGTALMFMEEGRASTFNFEQFKVGTYAIAENGEKVVDTVDRWFKLTARQAEQRFGKDRLSQKMKKALDAGKVDEEFKFIHCVLPMEDFSAIGGSFDREDTDERFAADMAFASVYLTEEEKVVVQKRGFEEMPYFCLRWSRWGTENQVWGCSPAFATLAEARQINFVKEMYQALAEKKAFPPVFVPDSVTGMVEQAAGSATTLPADDMARGVKPEQWLDKGEIQDMVEMLAEERASIQDAFFIKVFKALSQLGDKITESTYGAIALLQGENLEQFTGTFDQYRTELINLLVRRGIGIAYRGGLLKDPPQSLMVRPGSDPRAEPELAAPKINIKSRVTLALAQSKIQGVEKMLTTLMPFMEANPQIADNLNWNELTRYLGRGDGAPEGIFLPLKMVVEKQVQRMKMQKQELALKAAEIAAKGAGQLGKAPPKFQEMAGGLLDSASGGEQSQTG